MMSMRTALGLILALTILPALADTPPHGRWQPLPALWDEFNGNALDTSRWESRSPYYQGKPPGQYSTRNIDVDQGMLKLWARAETLPNAPSGYHDFTVAHLKSRQMVKYGYFEVRAKAMDARINSAFWLGRWTESGTYEIDIMEVGGASQGHETAVHTNTHVFLGDPALENDRNRLSDPFTFEASRRLADDFHVYGLEWDEQELRFYFDNRLIRRKANTHWHVPMHVMLTVETHPDWMGLPNRNDLPRAFLLDYFRAWRRGESAPR